MSKIKQELDETYHISALQKDVDDKPDALNGSIIREIQPIKESESPQQRLRDNPFKASMEVRMPIITKSSTGPMTLSHQTAAFHHISSIEQLNMADQLKKLGDEKSKQGLPSNRSAESLDSQK